jgi:hypothetical protein
LVSIIIAIEYYFFGRIDISPGLLPNETIDLFEYPAARCGDGHENRLNLRSISL